SGLSSHGIGGGNSVARYPWEDHESAMAMIDLCLDNDAARAELKQIADRLDAGSVTCSIGTTWTVATSLCHLAFWDQRALFQLKQWQKRGSVEAVRLNALTVDSINEAVNMMALQVPGPAAIAFALNSAAAVDAFCRNNWRRIG